MEKAGGRKLLGKYWARRLIQEAQGKRMEDPGDGVCRESRRKRWREPFIHVQQNNHLSKAETQGSCTSVTNQLPWHIRFHLPLELLHQRWHPAVFFTAGYPQGWGVTWELRLYSMSLAHCTGSHCVATWWSEFLWCYKMDVRMAHLKHWNVCLCKLDACAMYNKCNI